MISRSKSRLTCGGLVMANERDLRVAVPEGSDYIVSAFSWEPLQGKLQDN